MLLEQLSPAIQPILSETQRARLALISAWDLHDVHARVQSRLGWSTADADEAVLEYRKFMALVALHPAETYGMAEAVDEVWHTHILSTRDYLALCDSLVGEVIHHEQRPLDEAPDTAFAKFQEATLRDLARHFTGPVSQLWSASEGAYAAAKCCNHLTAASA